MEIDWKYGMTGDEHKACAEVTSNHFLSWHDLKICALEFESWYDNAKANNAEAYSLYLAEGDNYSKTCLKHLKRQVGQNITFNWGKPVGEQAGHNVVQVYINEFIHQ